MIIFAVLGTMALISIAVGTAIYYYNQKREK